MTATTTIVEDYLIGLLPHVRIERLDEGGFVATVPEAPGEIADGDTPPECITDLYERLECWVKDWSRRGLPLPVVQGIDLNTPENRALVACHDVGVAMPESGPVFEDGDAFIRYLTELRRSV